MTVQGDETLEVSCAVAHIHRGALALVCALIGGIGLCTMTAWLDIKDGIPVGPHSGLLSQYFPGYSVTWGGSLVGLFYGAVVGGIGGSVPRIFIILHRRSATTLHSVTMNCDPFSASC